MSWTQMTCATASVMVLSYDQKIRSDFIPLELVEPEKIGYSPPLVIEVGGRECDDVWQGDPGLTDKVKMFRAGGPAHFVFTAENFACTRFGNRRRRTRAFGPAAGSPCKEAVRRASQEMVGCEEKSHFFKNNWWNSE